MNIPSDPGSSPTPTELTPATTPAATTPTPSSENPLDPPPVQTQPTEAPAPLTAEALSIPEGFEVVPEQMDRFVSLVNEHGVTPDAANALLGLYHEQLTAMSEASASAFPAMVQQWRQEALALPEIAGNEEAAFGEIAKVLNTYGSDELRQVLDLTGAGDNPAVVQFFLKIAKQLNEPAPVVGSPAESAEQRSRANRLFGDMVKKQE